MRYRRTIGVAYSPRSLQIADAQHASDKELLLPDNPSEAQQMIARYVSENKLTGISAVLGIPADIVYLSLLKLPAGSRQTRESAINEHLQEFHDLSDSETVSDVSLVPVNGKDKHFLLAVARLDAIQKRIAPLQAAGIRIETAIPISLAFFNLAAQQHTHRKERIIVLCPVADTGIEILAGNEKTLLGVWRIPINTSENTQTFTALKTVKNELEKVYGNASSDRQAALTVVWCGKTPLADTIIELLSNAFGKTPVPFSRWHADFPLDKHPNTLPRALAQNTTQSPGIHLDLLPLAMRDRIVRRKRLPYRAIAAVFFAAFTITLSIYETRRSKDTQQRLHAAENNWQNRLALQEMEQQLKIRNATLSQQVSVLRDSALSPLLIRDLLMAIAKAKHPDDWIVRIADAQSYFNDRTLPVQKHPENEPTSPFMFQPQVFIVEGYTLGPDFASVRSLIETLRLHPQIIDVDLLGDDRVGPDRMPLMFRYIPRTHRFVMEVHIREP